MTLLRPFDRKTSTVLLERYKSSLSCPTCQKVLYKHPLTTTAMHCLYMEGNTTLYTEHDGYAVYECKQGHLWVAGMDTVIGGLYEWRDDNV